MKALRFGYMKFDSDAWPNKKEAVPTYETASFIDIGSNKQANFIKFTLLV